MKLRPIPCYQHEVPAILEGRQTELRRPIKLPKGVTEMERVLREGKHWPRIYTGKGALGWEWLDCPFGVPFDELWMQETWARTPKTAYWHDPSIPHRESPCGYYWAVYRAGWERCKPGPWRPSTQMSLWASRGRLVIADIGAERVQEITGRGCLAEGIPKKDGLSQGVPLRGDIWKDSKAAFRERYDSVHAKRGYGWEKNPPVWVVKFRLKG
jgi:hypothetical protein